MATRPRDLWYLRRSTMPGPSGPIELPIARRARERFGLEDLLDAHDGGPILGDLFTARLLAYRLDQLRSGAGGDEAAPGWRAGVLHAIGLLQEHWHSLVDDYRSRHGTDLFVRALAFLRRRFGPEVIDTMLATFAELFPPAPWTPVATEGDPTVVALEGDRGPDTAAEMPSSADTVPTGAAEEALLENALFLWLLHDNPATAMARPLFDDAELEAATGYRTIVSELADFFATLPPASNGEHLLETLRAPAQRAPDDLGHQLATAIEPPPTSAATPPETQRQRFQLGIDVLREEERPFPGFDAGPPPPPPVPSYQSLVGEDARYSQDRAWMASLVLVAKNVLVWLDQLSRSEERPITRLDEVPDRELARLSRLGFRGLWLIGIWRRSTASARIKVLCGNPEAAASAYALDDYEVDESLGGEEALDDLRARAAAHGLRLACDMVPNHMGIDSRWVLEHPERFLTTSDCPYPSYRFDGPDLSPDPTVSIHLEDHYYERSDAAVVFRRQDHENGEIRYLYHGNDGTHLPWNDTAQLDYLEPATREAVIETIAAVARRFPVIRFDAAMTLAKQHVQRLWHPPPGSTEGIPSRAERAVTPADFEAAMPEEFWREVVARVAEAAPDTLLLAEAFWLMEGYFVRSLGMHRVYNSAFMHMLRDEENTKYRQALVEALSFDPALLQRFVNFLTTPDERPAAEQFGTGDKYFGAATLMATLPGLPMFGHGQVEGLREQYGMEYRRAYRDEQVDAAMVARHERALAPLLARRELFAHVAHFQLFEVEPLDEASPTDPGHEHVYAFCNRHRDARAIVLFHNRDGRVVGRLRRTVPRITVAPEAPDAGVEGTETHEATATAPVACTSVLEALGLEAAARTFVRGRDPVRGLDFLLSAEDLERQGLRFALGPYESRVLVDLETFVDRADGAWRALWSTLGERGVPDLDVAFAEREAEPRQAPWRPLLDGPFLTDLLAVEHGEATAGLDALRAALEPMRDALTAVRSLTQENEGKGGATDGGGVTDKSAAAFDPAVAEPVDEPNPKDGARETADIETRVEAVIESAARTLGVVRAVDLGAEGDPSTTLALAIWAVLRDLGQLEARTRDEIPERSRVVFDRDRLGLLVTKTLRSLGSSDTEASREVAALALMLRHARWHRPGGSDSTPLAGIRRLLDDDETRRVLHVHRFDEVVWFDQEAFRVLVRWLRWTGEVATRLDEIELDGENDLHGGQFDRSTTIRDAIARLADAEAPSEYRFSRLLASLASGGDGPGGTDSALSCT